MAYVLCFAFSFVVVQLFILFCILLYFAKGKIAPPPTHALIWFLGFRFCFGEREIGILESWRLGGGDTGGEPKRGGAG